MRNKKGFSLTEIMIVVGIIGILLAIILPNYVRAQSQAQMKICNTNQKIIFSAATLYMINEPTSLEAITGDTERLQELDDKGYLRNIRSCACPNNKTTEYGDYRILFEGNIVSDVQCLVKTDEHVWP